MDSPIEATCLNKINSCNKASIERIHAPEDVFKK